MKRNTLRLFSYIERMKCEEVLKKMYVSEVEGHNKRGKPLGRWNDEVKEYMGERG